MALSKDRTGAIERIRHAILAGLIALALSYSTVLSPLDQVTWVAQSRVSGFEASGDIVYVGSSSDLSDPAFPERRQDLAVALDTLREAGAERVYVDMTFNRSVRPEVDTALNTALRAYGGDAYLVRNLATDLNGELDLSQSVGSVGAGIPVVGSMRWKNYIGYSWSMPTSVVFRGEEMPSLAASIADVPVSAAEYPINYGFERSTIPSHRFLDLLSSQDSQWSFEKLSADIAGKIIVIGNTNRADTNAPNIPGYIDVPATMVDIYAAETLKAGYTRIVDEWLVVLCILCALVLASIAGSRWLRSSVVVLCLVALLSSVYVAATLGTIMSAAGGLTMLGTYSLFRARANWKSNYRLVDPDTGLPTFSALEADQDTAETVPAIIVAKIHRFEEVRRTLPQELHAEYLLRIVGRLKAAKKDATIYVGPGHLIAWTFPEKEPALIREHLEGLRALFSSPLIVGENQVDVGITFGVDLTASPNVTRRLAAAVDAAERTNETYEPIAIAEVTSDEDLIWNISIQARIDAALSNGEIYLIYQPKVLIETGEMIGVEALVRWRDPVKGLIPPDHFIRQCENAGRMTQLTRHVLVEGCKAGMALAARGLHIPVAVNISATLVHERDILAMVREVLEETGFDPEKLTLEITETYRISNFERANEILSDLRALGPKISMDDFGVGAASLEALQCLPFDELKIDRTFTSAIKDNPKAEAIVRNILQLGKDLRIMVVAEGIEDAATLTKLRDSGGTVAQGFGISRPISLQEIMVFQSFNQIERLRDIV
jgi:EAL domain-containing protein (putative c-di-GMP-specific phosphodiesterase class I)/CHASE2 domain-containing sensor protein